MNKQDQQEPVWKDRHPAQTNDIWKECFWKIVEKAKASGADTIYFTDVDNLVKEKIGQEPQKCPECIHHWPAPESDGHCYMYRNEMPNCVKFEQKEPQPDSGEEYCRECMGLMSPGNNCKSCVGTGKQQEQEPSGFEEYKKAIIDSFSTGYEAGHNDTVESQYGDSIEQAEDWFIDAVEDGTIVIPAGQQSKPCACGLEPILNALRNKAMRRLISAHINEIRIVAENKRGHFRDFAVFEAKQEMEGLNQLQSLLDKEEV